VAVRSGATGPAVPGINVFVDKITLRDCWHSLMSVQNTTFGSSNYQIGGRGFGGTCTLTNCYGQYAADDGFETNAMTYALHDNCVAEDAAQEEFYHTNFNYPKNDSTNGINEQRIVYRNCRARRLTSLPTPSQTVGFFVNNNVGVTPAIASGEVIYDGCVYYQSQADFQSNAGALTPNAMSLSGSIARIAVRDFKVVLDAINFTNVSSTTAAIVSMTGLTGTNQVDVRGLSMKLVGAKGGGSGALAVYGLRLAGVNTQFTLADIDFDFNISSVSATTFVPVDIGATAGSNMSGVIRRVKFLNLSADTAPWCIWIHPTSSLTIQGRIDIEECDFRLVPASAVEIKHSDNTNQPFVFYRNNRWRTFPKASAAMGTANFAAATFTTATGNQYNGGDPAEIHFAKNTGQGISKIEVSKDGTTYEAVFEQSAAATTATDGTALTNAGGMIQDVLVPVDNGDFVKVTFATTQPTTRVRFRK
jgi:hypothetical protein